jgi:2-phospho-L-lactate/phosphoenolpyruvate guanylyltransferase
MIVWAIVPVKPLRRGKSRLSGVLTEDERAALNQCLLINTLDILKEVPGVEYSLVVSRDPEALALAREHGARTVLEHGAPQLNLALLRATQVAKSHTIGGVLILPADLPLLRIEDITAILERANDPPVVVIAPDRHRQGTNALFVCPVGLIQYNFGPGSFQSHCEQARQLGARLEICELPSLALDVDLPEDLALASEELEGLGI